MLNHVNHDAAHYMIQALSLTEAGSDLVKGLEEIRYYHRYAEVYDLGYNGILVEAFDEDTDGYRYWEGSVLIPSKRDRLIYESAAYQDEPVQGALFWGWGYGDDDGGCGPGGGRPGAGVSAAGPELGRYAAAETVDKVGGVGRIGARNARNICICWGVGVEAETAGGGTVARVHCRGH